MSVALLIAPIALAIVCATAVAIRWIDRCDCRFANTTDSEEE